MTSLSASDARARLYKLLDEAAESHEPIRIEG
jgi:PHD/YefM family antitoxin component YafN of YafNO toxin-antitoxin module